MSPNLGIKVITLVIDGRFLKDSRFLEEFEAQCGRLRQEDDEFRLACAS
jgi:hypothetical protein